MAKAKGRRALAGGGCAIARSLGLVGDSWSLLIVRDALSGSRRFGEFQSRLGIAKNILSARLKKLVEAGILETTPASDGSAYSEYALTEKGEQLYLVLVALWQWGEKFAFAPGERTLKLLDRDGRCEMAPLALSSRDGRALGPRDYVAEPIGASPAH